MFTYFDKEFDTVDVRPEMIKMYWDEVNESIQS